MIHYLKGKLSEKKPTYAVIDCNGVGYHLNISLYTYEKLPNDEACKLYTHLSIKEDAHTLFGFVDEFERDIFLHLLSVSGVGASTARMILSTYPPQETFDAITSGNVGLLQRVKGIGSKSAQRIILELKDKLPKMDLDSLDVSSTKKPIAASSSQADEAVSALVMLGYNKAIAEKNIHKILSANDAPLPVEQLIKAALKSI
jgi:holliday junction DNA helicase RuvA